MKIKVTLHKNGEVTFWSVYDQTWIRSRVIPDREIAAMASDTRKRVLRHLAK